MNSPGSAYPPSRYLSAVGKGNSREEAENAAYGGLSRSSLRMVQAAVSANHSLINASIGETWRGGGKHYAVAVLPIPETVIILQRLVEENETAIAEYLRIAREDPDPIYRYSFVSMARILAMESDGYRRQLLVLAPSLPSGTEYGGDALLAEERRVLKGVTFKAESGGAGGDLFAEAVKKALNEMDMRTVRRNPAYLLTASAPSFVELGENEGMRFLDARIRFVLTDAEGAEFESFSFKKRVGYRGGLEEGKAQGRRMLLLEVENGFAGQFDAFLNDLLAE